MRGLPLGVLGDALVLAAVALGDVGEAQEAAEHFLAGASLGQLAVLPQPRHLRGRTAPGVGGQKKKQPGSNCEGVARVCEEKIKMQKYEKATSNRDVRGHQEAARDG